MIVDLNINEQERAIIFKALLIRRDSLSFEKESQDYQGLTDLIKRFRPGKLTLLKTIRSEVAKLGYDISLKDAKDMIDVILYKY